MQNAKLDPIGVEISPIEIPDIDYGDYDGGSGSGGETPPTTPEKKLI